MREFRGMTTYTIPSPCLDELPREGVKRIENDDMVMIDEVRPTSKAAQMLRVPPPELERPMGQPRPRKAPAVVEPESAGIDVKIGALVRHRVYGMGKVLELNGQGIGRRVKIRFATEGDRTFVLNRAPLELVGQGD